MKISFNSFLFCFGLGYTARHYAVRRMAHGWRVAGTGRDPEDGQPHRLAFWRGAPLAPGVLTRVSHLLISIPPDSEGDPVLAEHGDDIAKARPAWIGYLSSTGIYGDRNGAIVDEKTEPCPQDQNALWRLSAEREWLDFGARHCLPVHIFRLSGIYGPGRSALDRIRAGARCIDKPGHIVNRIHVSDIAHALDASMARPNPGQIYNLADNEPTSSCKPLLYAAKLLGQPVPPFVPFEQANLSPTAAIFYSASRRVCNRRLQSELGVTLAYPTYRDGLDAIYRQEVDERLN